VGREGVGVVCVYGMRRWTRDFKSVPSARYGQQVRSLAVPACCWQLGVRWKGGGGVASTRAGVQ